MTPTHTTPPQLVSGRGLSDARSVRTRVEQDIELLSHRIAAIKRTSPHNKPVIEAYQSMLDSRVAVYKWLEHGRSAHRSGPH